MALTARQDLILAVGLGMKAALTSLKNQLDEYPTVRIVAMTSHSNGGYVELVATIEVVDE
jgi:predicted translin family RNA/ssDNA-binding protein